MISTSKFDQFKISLENEETYISDFSKYNHIKFVYDADILIVDDNEFNRMILGSILTQFKIKFTEACDGKDALDKILDRRGRSKEYKVIIMDCNMPGMTGFECARRISKFHNDRTISKMPFIIAHSAYTSDDDRNACLQSGMVEYLTKPCAPDRIIKTILKYLSFK